MILSDYDCRISFELKMKTKNKIISVPLYYNNYPLYINGDLLTDKKSRMIELVKDNLWTKRMAWVMMWINKKASIFREYLNVKNPDLSLVKPCKDCNPNYCYFHKYCKKLEIYRRSRQTKFGRKKIIIR
jgi:hypothetical protein